MRSFHLTSLRLTRSDRWIVAVVAVILFAAAVFAGWWWGVPAVNNWYYRDAMKGWVLTDYYPKPATLLDARDYLQAEGLPATSHMLFYTNGQGRHRMLITESISQRKARYHILEYDVGGNRVEVDRVPWYP